MLADTKRVVDIRITILRIILDIYDDHVDVSRTRYREI
jgi:hypothetical protein